MRLSFALAFLLILAGCGGGGGSGGGSPPPPPPPPVEVVDLYDGAWNDRGGTFAAQGDTGVEFNVDHLRLTFSTVLGEVVCYPTNSSTGWRATVQLGGVDHSVWFWPAEDHLSVTETATPSSRAFWTLTPLAGGG